MSEPSYQVFEEIEVKAKLLQQYWAGFREEIINYLPDTYHSEIEELSGNLDKALDKLLDELHNPTLILATTGTTSSGKSTLVNFLCGAEILPVTVDEMSAGAVSIEYSEETSLIIHETQNALWECGEWKNISAENIRKRLYRSMLTYLDNREEQPNLVSPQFTIYYPFQLLKDSNLELPRGTKVRLLDLPGLSHVGDEDNASVIRQCREALCLVTYNSAETDRQKVRNLLQEVVEQVKDLGGSPARMLFILNRIDVFRSDREWPETENRFVKNTVRRIKQELLEQLGEYGQEIENLQVSKLSTMPALLSLQIRDSDEQISIYASTKAYREFNGLISENTLEDLPHRAEKWTEQDRKRVASDLRAESYASDFEEQLKSHITQNFPKLVIPQVIDKFNSDAGDSVARWSVQITTACLNSSEERYQQECQNISEVRAEVDNFLQVSNDNLRKPLAKLEINCDESIENDLLLNLRGTVLSLQQTEPYCEIKLKLIPLYDWQEQISRVIKSVLESVASSLDEGKINLDNSYFKTVDSPTRKLLESQLKLLIDEGYCSENAKNGWTIIAKKTEDKSKLQRIREYFKNLSTTLTMILNPILRKTHDQERERIYSLVSELFKFHLSYLDKGLNNDENGIAKNYVIKFPNSELNKITRDLNFSLDLQSDFEISQKKYRSFKNWLWLQEKQSDNAEIPSTGKLIEDWRQQFRQQCEPTIFRQMFKWLLEQIDDLKKNLDTRKDEVLDLYLERLEKARREITIDYEKEKDRWEQMQERAKDLAENFSNLRIVEKEETNF